MPRLRQRNFPAAAHNRWLRNRVVALYDLKEEDRAAKMIHLLADKEDWGVEQMKQDSGNRPDSLQKVFEYQQATKHSFQGYARGPGYLDWGYSAEPFSSV